MSGFSFCDLKRNVCFPETTHYPFAEAVVFGAGGRGQDAVKALRDRGVIVAAVLDNDVRKHGTDFLGIPVVSPDFLSERKLPVIIASAYEMEMFNQLLAMDHRDLCFFHPEVGTFPEEFVENVPRLDRILDSMGDEASREMFIQTVNIHTRAIACPIVESGYPQYEHPLVTAAPGDVILDIGGMHGETALLFAERTGMDCMVYTFEPSPANIEHIREQVKSLPKVIEVVEKGAWSHATTLRFDADFPQHDAGSHKIDPDGKEVIEVMAIDTFVRERGTKVDLIKMDIEGAELEALVGAKETIRKYGPKLQISIYHEFTHLWEIFEAITEMRPDYTFYLGHHSTIHTETVLYAVRNGR